jgi:iduronate 2-sulfatase
LHITQNGCGHKYALEENCVDQGKKAAATEMADVADTAYIDGKVAMAAIDILNEIKDSTFFLAVGFRRPHLPFSAPKRFWDLYEREKIPLPENSFPPKDAPALALHNWVELRGYTDIPENGDMDEEKVRELRHAYYAAISYVDAQIGKLIHELEQLALLDKTVIVLWSDHGFHLGEHGLWCKTTNFELDTRVPLIISVPGQKAIGTTTNAIVEYVDIYPTLADICELPVPENLAGKSLQPLLLNPSMQWDGVALSQFPRPWFYENQPEVMGYSIRTDRYRYTQWIETHSGNVVARELYDHKKDPGENVNVVPNHQKIVANMEEKLKMSYQKMAWQNK